MCLQMVSLLLAALAVAVHGVTLDEYEVIMRQTSDSHMDDSEDLFGYSAALHNTEDPNTPGRTFTQKISSARILVGVPNGTPLSTDSVTRPGYVMSCSLTSDPQGGRCMPFRGSDTGNDRRLYDVDGNSNDEEKDSQFLGVSMESRDGRFAVCAHKWKYRGQPGGVNRLVQGFCLRSGRALAGFEMLRPCTYDSNAAAGTFNAITSITQDSTGFGFCSSGTDISFMSNGNLIISAPGTYLWRGVNFVHNGSSILPNTIDNQMNNFGYSGMSVRQARVSSPDKLEWVSGSPRSSNYFGQVFVYDYNEATTSVSDGQIYQQFSSPSIVLTGQQIGAYFGYSIAAVDFNGDRFDDVLVGAPLYFKGSSLPEVGAVYIYENTVNNNIGSLSDTRRITLTAPGGGVVYSRFGHAIAPLGDLDADGFDDVAISAPFGQGLSGTVYIYRGSRQGIITTPAQTLVGSELNLMPDAVAGLTSFGAFLSGTTDIDGNQYNDLVIGAFMSRKVFVIRSRTVAIISASVTPSSTSVQIRNPPFCDFDNSDNDCFEVTYCLSLSGKGFSDGQSIAVNYTLYTDNRTSGLPPRATFRSSGSGVMSNQTSLTVSSAPCALEMREIVYVDSSYTVENLQAPALRPAMDVSIPQGDTPPQSDGNVAPIDLTQNRIFMRLEGTQSATVVGARECEGNCSSDISVSSNSVSYISRSDSEFRERRILRDVVSDIVFNTTVANAGPDTAYTVLLVFTHPTALSYSRVDGGGQFTCMSDQSAGVTTCTVANVLGNGIQIPVSVRFVVLRGSLNGSVSDIAVSIRTSSSGSDEDESNNMYTFTLPVASRVSPSVSVSVFPDQLEIVQDFSRSALPTNVAEIGRELRINFALTNSGPSTIGQGRLTIHLPYRTPCTRNSFLFYILSVSDIGLQGGQCVSETPSDIDRLRLAGTVQGASSELGNATTTRAAADPVVLDDVEGVCDDSSRMNIECDRDTKGCVTVVCNINTQISGYTGQVVVTGYLDDVYLKDVLVPVQLSFAATYELLDGSSAANPADSTDSDTLELNPDVAVVAAANFEFWPIIVAAVVAMIFIVIAVIALWACGFFKRRQKWKTQQEDEHQEGQEATVSTEEEVPNGAEKPNAPL